MTPPGWLRRLRSWWQYRPNGSAARAAALREPVRADVGETSEDALDVLRALKWIFHYAPDKRNPEAIAAVLKRPSPVTGHASAYDVIMIFDAGKAYGYRTLENDNADPFNPSAIAYHCFGSTVQVCGEMLALPNPSHEDAPTTTHPPTEDEAVLTAKFRGPKEVRYP